MPNNKVLKRVDEISILTKIIVERRTSVVVKSIYMRQKEEEGTGMWLLRHSLEGKKLEVHQLLGWGEEEVLINAGTSGLYTALYNI